MQNDELTLDPQEEITEGETAEEAVEETEESESTDVEAELARVKAEAAKWRRLAQKAKPEPKPQTLPTREVGKLDDEAIDLRLDGYSKEEVAFILKNGGRKALEDPYVAGAIAQRREQSKAEDESSKAKDTSGATSFEKKYPKEKLDKMTAEELAKILPHTEE
jgi:hypothetical protein